MKDSPSARSLPCPSHHMPQRPISQALTSKSSSQPYPAFTIESHQKAGIFPGIESDKTGYFHIMLTDAQIRKAKPHAKPYKLPDGAGLHLFVSPAGGKLWRYRYEIAGKEKTLSIGPYPAVSLSDARAARDAAKATLRAGRDPGGVKRQRKIEATTDTFEAIAREWYALNRSTWTPTHSGDVIRSLDRDVFPIIGTYPIRDITAPVVLALLRRIEARPAIETAHRIRQRMSAVFVYAIASGRADSDPAAIVQQALAPIAKGRQPAITDLTAARKMLFTAEAEPAYAVTKLALRFLALTAVRPGTLAQTPWSELSYYATDPTWRIPAVRMKLSLARKKDETLDHLVPLPRQAIDVLEVLRTLTGNGTFVFPNTRHAHKPMSENAMGYLLNRAGYHHRHVPHGWRTTFSTVMNELFPADRHIIDLMLAHVPKDKVESAYNRAAHMPRRRELSQVWADMLLEGATPAASLLGGARHS